MLIHLPFIIALVIMELHTVCTLGQNHHSQGTKPQNEVISIKGKHSTADRLVNFPQDLIHGDTCNKNTGYLKVQSIIYMQMKWNTNYCLLTN